MANLIKTFVLMVVLVFLASPVGALNEVWTYTDEGDPLPPSRSGHSAINDLAGDRMIIFGGMADTYGIERDDMWAMDNNTFVWSELEASNDGPVGLRDHAAIYDPVNNSMIFFGGVYNSGAITDDVWILDLGTLVWTQQIADTETWPIPRFNCYGVYSQNTNEMVVFGGRNLSSRLDDLWALDLTTYTWRQIPYLPLWPSPREGAPMVMIGPDDFLMFGGYDPAVSHYNDIWTFDLALNQWTEYDPPDPLPEGRRRCSLAYDTVNNRVLIHGGTPLDYLGAFEDLWQFDLNTDSYTELTPTGDIPAGRGYHSIVESFGGHKIAIFAGGDYGPGDIFNDTYFLDWEEVGSEVWTFCDTGDPKPPVRSGHSAIHDVVGERMVIFGGMAITYGKELDDMWAMDENTLIWDELIASNDGPEGLRDHAAIYNPLTNSMILFGGVYDSGDITNDVWILDLATLVWTQQVPDASPWPIPRFNCYGVYSQNTSEMVVFGGRDMYTRLNDLWALDLNTFIWREIPNSGPWPSPREGAPMVSIDPD
ncbi:MAG: hypothetical protein GY839_17400, partial [candidate division Zixibacteria bacterium]|nr:hypothetical protein [candidate division Zixibacteria bacterium]